MIFTQRFFLGVMALVTLGFLTGCGLIPASGPYGNKIERQGVKSQTMSDKISGGLGLFGGQNAEKTASKFSYKLVDLDQNVLKNLAMQKRDKAHLADWPQNNGPETITVNVGDTIDISIFESQSGGLFVPSDAGTRPGNFVTLPSQTINESGVVTVPYAGQIQAAGQSTEEIGKSIEDRLRNRAIEPQVVVTFSSRQGAEVSVIGDVNNATRLSLGFNPYKILDAIAEAGGPSAPGYETKIMLQRDGKEYNLPFEQLVLDPQKNIYAQVNDTLYLYQEPEIFIAYGAVGVTGRIAFGKRKLYLAEALGLARGLSDGQADPAEVYIYRQDHRVSQSIVTAQMLLVNEKPQIHAAILKDDKHAIETPEAIETYIILRDEEVEDKLNAAKTVKPKVMENPWAMGQIIMDNPVLDAPVIPVPPVTAPVEKAAIIKPVITTKRVGSIQKDIAVQAVEKSKSLVSKPFEKQQYQVVEIKQPVVKAAPVQKTEIKKIATKDLIEKSKKKPEAIKVINAAPVKSTEAVKSTAPVKPEVQPAPVKETTIAIVHNPIIYKVNMRDPKGFFLAQKFEMQDNDIIYVGNAKTVEFQKFLSVINPTTSSANSIDDTF